MRLMRDLKEGGRGDEGQTRSNETLMGLRNSPQLAVSNAEMTVVSSQARRPNQARAGRHSHPQHPDLSKGSLWKQDK